MPEYIRSMVYVVGVGFDSFTNMQGEQESSADAVIYHKNDHGGYNAVWMAFMNDVDEEVQWQPASDTSDITRDQITEASGPVTECDTLGEAQQKGLDLLSGLFTGETEVKHPGSNN